MQWIKLFLEFFQEIAWPVAIIVLAFVLRNQILELLKLLRRIKYKGFEAEFQEIASEVQESGMARVERPTEADLAQEKRFLNLATGHPVAAIIDAWKDVEMAIVAIRQSHEIQHPPTTDFEYMARLRQDGFLDPSVHRIYKHLQRLRNEAVHSRDPDAVSAGEAIQYRELTRALASQLEHIAQQARK